MPNLQLFEKTRITAKPETYRWLAEQARQRGYHMTARRLDEMAKEAEQQHQLNHNDSF